MPRYELSDGTSNKFWDIKLAGKSFTTTFGKIGSAGQTQLKQFASDAEARAAHDKLVAEKRKKGYAPAGAAKQPGKQAPKAAARGAAPPPKTKPNPALEKAIDGDPYDTEAYAVYADWLQEQGDPRGELIALQLAGKHKQAKALIARQADYFLGPLAEHQQTYDGEDDAAFTWKFGFIHALRLSHDHYADEDFEGSLAEILELVLRHPSGRFLAEITFVFNNDPNEDDLQDLIDLLAKRAPPTIRRLHFGDFNYAGAVHDPSSPTATGNTEISWYAIGNLGKLWKAVPGLRTLITQGGSDDSVIASGFKLGSLELPALTHAEFRTGGLMKANAKAIATAKIPKIEHLDIWYGDDNYGGDATIKEVQLLIGRTDLPKLRHLGLRNARFANELPAVLAKAGLVKQLTELDLSLGVLDDEGAQALAAHKDAFKHLAVLDVSYNYLTKTGIAALKGVAKQVVTSKQRTDDDPEYRSPAVGE